KRPNSPANGAEGIEDGKIAQPRRNWPSRGTRRTPQLSAKSHGANIDRPAQFDPFSAIALACRNQNYGGGRIPSSADSAGRLFRYGVPPQASRTGAVLPFAPKAFRRRRPPLRFSWPLLRICFAGARLGREGAAPGHSPFGQWMQF